MLLDGQVVGVKRHGRCRESSIVGSDLKKVKEVLQFLKFEDLETYAIREIDFIKWVVRRG